MDAIDTILTRRSVRTYTKDDVPDDVTNKILESAVSAPSAGNQQPWHFIIICDREILDKIPDFHPNAKLLKGVQKAILICADLNLEKYKGYWMLDCSAAAQNMLLAARALGLGSCWLGVYPREDRIKNLRKMLNIPDNVIPHSIIAIGYTDVKQEKVSRDFSSRTHKNKW